MGYEYKAVGAPEKGKRRRSAKSRSDRVAAAMEDVLNHEASDGWEYLRTDLLPVQERTGLFSRVQETHRAVMIFRRAIVPIQLDQPEVRTPVAASITPTAPMAPAAPVAAPGPVAPAAITEPTEQSPRPSIFGARKSKPDQPELTVDEPLNVVREHRHTPVVELVAEGGPKHRGDRGAD